ncbi:MAG: primosomal protein N' [Holosporales bacterium]|jgi:primosomal protein N' (replication factor Y)|nr:primosomal protein N' [Holosporales bacterium]
MPKLFDVLVSAPIDRLYTYSCAEDGVIEPGQIVKVPFGSRTAIGVVWFVKESSELINIKEISRIYGYPPIPPTTLEFIEKVADYNILDRGAVLKMVLSESTLFKDIKQKPHVCEASVIPEKIRLTDDQEKAASCIFGAVDQAKFATFCLDGVTGSGKTETYLKVCEYALTKGRQCLILLPEISLTPQMVDRLKKYFGIPPLIWHSSVTPKNRRNTWLKALNGEVGITIAARSGLFLPFSNLGLIVVDEEHDPSYKQEEGTIYNARDMAVLRAKILGIPAVLSSATPSVETVNNCLIGKYTKLQLPIRFSKVQMPEIDIVNMRGFGCKGNEYISDVLLSEIKAAIGLNRQALLYINRRGFAPITLCNKCGRRIQCPNCTSWLVEHKNYKILTCHYCGHQLPKPSLCPQCGEDGLFAFGAGVERIQRELADKLPSARIVVASSDTVPTVQRMQQLYDDIVNHRCDVIVGTQIFSKGHHFPDISLVGVIDADAGLMGSDPRASEQTYQAIQQVSGRAGRAQVRGKVLLQTYSPDTPLFKALKEYNSEEFFRLEMHSRKVSQLPPYARLAAIIMSSNDAKQVEEFAKKIVASTPSANAKASSLQILGPAPAAMARLQGRNRWRILLRAVRHYDIQSYIRAWLKATKVPSSIRLTIDIDPYNLWF